MDLPLQVEFSVDALDHNYVSQGQEEDMDNGNDVVMPPNCSFYITND